MTSKKCQWPFLLNALVWLLAACDSGDAVRTSNVRAAAAQLPSGVTTLPVRAVDSQPPAKPSELYELFRGFQAPGLRIHAAAVDAQPALLLVAVDLQHFEPVVVGTDGNLRAGVSASEAIVSFGLDLVVGSSFVSELHSLAPVGLLQIEGQTISEVQGHGYTRILGVRADGLSVVASREYHRGMFESAMQVGPGVVERGALDISERDLERPRYFRTFVGTCGATAIIGASQVPMHLYTLGQRFLTFVAEIGLSCDEVVNLAGDREAVLAAASPDRGRIAYLGHPQTAKAALLGFRRRE